MQTITSGDESEESQKIAKAIKKLIEGGVRPSEIAVLYRINALSRSLEEGLNRAGIAYKLVGGLRFYDRAEIKDLISYLRVVTNVHDNFSLKRIINKPKRGLGKATIDKIQLSAMEAGKSMFEFIATLPDDQLEALVRKKSAQELRDFVAEITELRRVADEAIYRFIDLLEERFKIKTSKGSPTKPTKFRTSTSSTVCSVTTSNKTPKLPFRNFSTTSRCKANRTRSRERASTS